MRKIPIVFALLLAQIFSGAWVSQARADSMSTFLKSCGYGALAGAAVGLASLAVSDNPGGKTNNVARGASLGLYVGIGAGFYMVNNPTKTGSEFAGMVTPNDEVHLAWISPMVKARMIEGGEFHWVARSF